MMNPVNVNKIGATGLVSECATGQSHSMTVFLANRLGLAQRFRMLFVPGLILALGLVSCSSPRAPAPIVDRSNKLPPVVIISSVGQKKPELADQKSSTSSSTSTSAASSQRPVPSQRPAPPQGPVQSPKASAPGSETAAANPSTGGDEPRTASASPVRNPQVVSSSRAENTDSPASSDKPASVPRKPDSSPKKQEPAIAKQEGVSKKAETTTAKPSTPQIAAGPVTTPDDPPVSQEATPSKSSTETQSAETPAVSKPAASPEVDWIWPAQGKVVSNFASGKGGIRIEGSSGDPIVAIGDGKVIFAGQGPKGYGNLLIVRHEGELLSVYAHNRALLVQEGNQVRKGQKIAEMGDSGADRTQLGFELRRHGRPIDPRSALPQR